MITHGYLAHHGILGQKWGIRRYQNSDGSYTPAGKKRYKKEHYNEYLDKHDKYYEEYYKTKEGREKFKQVKKNYQNALDRDGQYTDEEIRVRDDYYQSAGAYIAKKLLQEYGPMKLSALEYSKGDAAILDDKKLTNRIIDYVDAIYEIHDELRGRLTPSEKYYKNNPDGDF